MAGSGAVSGDGNTAVGDGAMGAESSLRSLDGHRDRGRRGKQCGKRTGLENRSKLAPAFGHANRGTAFSGASVIMALVMRILLPVLEPPSTFFSPPT